MCQAFSGLMKENGEVVWKFGVDSHEGLIKLGKLRDDTDRKDQLTFARFEIAPANGSYLAPDKWVFKLDEEIKPSWWSKAHEKWAWDAQKEWLAKLDKILIRKQIVHPFRDINPPKKITKRHLALLKKWASVWTSVWEDSAGDSVRASVRASVWAYAGSFFSLPRSVWKHAEKIKGKGYPFQPAVDLWTMGLVPSFDGKVWRLHGGKDGKVLWEGKP